jgi:hypothetical protein
LNYLIALNGLFWLFITLTGFIFIQRILHREFQAFLLILSRNPRITQVIFSLVFLPGVFLHEISHFIMAKILFVPTGKFSLLPHARSDGTLRLGYVETATGGFIRDSLIGVAPLAAGCVIVSYVASSQMNVVPLWDLILNGEWGVFWITLSSVLNSSGFWLWFYLAFAVSSMMMPSQSDRHAWLPLGILIIGLIILAILAGAGTWMLEKFAPYVNNFMRALALIFVMSGMLHIVLTMPLLLLHWILTRVTGMDVK